MEVRRSEEEEEAEGRVVHLGLRLREREGGRKKREREKRYIERKGEACIHSGHSGLKMSLPFICIHFWNMSLSKPWRKSSPFDQAAGWKQDLIQCLRIYIYIKKTHFHCPSQLRTSDSLSKHANLKTRLLGLFGLCITPTPVSGPDMLQASLGCTTESFCRDST